MAVGKGMWFRDVYNHLCKENFVIDKEVRKVEPFCAMLKRMVVAAAGRPFRKVVPLRYRQCLKSVISPASYKS